MLEETINALNNKSFEKKLIKEQVEKINDKTEKQHLTLKKRILHS